VRFSPDGNKLVSVGADKMGFLFEGKNGDPVGKIEGHTAGIYSCSWSADSKKFVTASADKTCKIWSENGNALQTFNFADDVDHQQLGCLWQGEHILSVGLNGEITYLDPDHPNTPKRILRGHNKSITALAYDSQNKHIYTGSYDALIVRWEVDTGNTEAMNGKGHTNQISSMHIQGGNLISCSMDDTVRITPLSSRQYSDAITLDSTPADIAVAHKDQKLIVAVVTDSIVVIKDGKVATKLPAKYQPTCVSFSVDDTLLAVGAKDNNIYLYSVSGTKLSEGPVLKGHRGPLTVVSYSPDGKYLCSGDHNRDIFVWDLKTNQIKIQGWVFHTARVNSLSWSPDSLHIVSGSLDSNLIVWSIEDSSKRIAIKGAHYGGVNKCLWLDNHNVVSVGQDCCMKTWTITY